MLRLITEWCLIGDRLWVMGDGDHGQGRYSY
jgi:hypothetical protein